MRRRMSRRRYVYTPARIAFVPAKFSLLRPEFWGYSNMNIFEGIEINYYIYFSPEEGTDA